MENYVEKSKGGMCLPPYSVPPTSPRSPGAGGEVGVLVGAAHFVEKSRRLRLTWGTLLALLDSLSAPVRYSRNFAPPGLLTGWPSGALRARHYPEDQTLFF